MRLLVTTLLLIVIRLNVSAQQFQFKTSKVYCVLNFLETATQQPRTSLPLYEFINAKTSGDADFKAICKEFKSIQLHPNYHFDGYPANRLHDYNIFNLIVSASVNSADNAEFKEKILGYLPNTELIKLLAVMQKAEV
ncbi:hypothetical protein [Hymenobacter terrenus]|uniref:hypothetical protein n=1 Tax=Hymenobacter terrenus TaxID=1629124 RepID=UPI000696A30B|nr:hypothetical protein [Hymenobacter terrenus]